MSWSPPDSSLPISITLTGEGFASLAWVMGYAPPAKASQGQSITLRVDITNTGVFRDKFRVIFNINGVVTNYDIAEIYPSDLDTVSHTFTMPGVSVTGSVTGVHEVGALGLPFPAPISAGISSRVKGLAVGLGLLGALGAGFLLRRT